MTPVGYACVAAYALIGLVILAVVRERTIYCNGSDVDDMVAAAMLVLAWPVVLGFVVLSLVGKGLSLVADVMAAAYYMAARMYRDASGRAHGRDEAE